ncbi:MAG: LamG-like jellyroll fold domain-containing protein [Nocardioidaceae bacterium]
MLRRGTVRGAQSLLAVSLTMVAGTVAAGTATAGTTDASGDRVRAAYAVTSSLRGLWHLDETTGAVAVDSSGLKHNGKIFAATLGVDGFLGTSFQFNSDKARVEVPSAADLNPGTSNFEVTAHIYLDAAPAKGETYDVFRKGLSSTSGGEFKLEIVPGGRAQCTAKDSKKLVGKVVAKTTSLADQAWHMVGCRRVGNTWSVVVDGKVVSKTVSFGSISNTKKISIGGKYGQEDGVRGRVDEVQFWIG